MKATTLTFLFLLAASTAPAQWTPALNDRPNIAVTGEAVIYVTPDKIEIALGIETNDKEIQAAKDKNAAILKRTIAAIKECSVEEKDIKTDHLSIEPRWHDSHQENFIGYFVRNTLVVTLNDPAKLDKLVTSSLVAGVNFIHGVTFQTTELRKHRDQAREMALKAAREKADKMAAALGQTAGKALQINEVSSPWGYGGWYGVGWGWGWGRSGGMTQNVAQSMTGGAGGEGGDTIALGQIAIRANVSVTFELKD